MNESTCVMMKKQYLQQTASLLLLTANSFLLTTHHAQAQREVQYAQYLVNPLAINPAATGIRETFHFNAVLRRQFVAGVQGLPITQSFAMDGTVANGKIGLGLQGLNDRVSANTAVFGSISYIHKISDYQKLSIGALGGINVLPARDVLNTGGNINKALPSAGVGIYYEDETFFGGVSMPEILKQQYGYNSTSGLINYQRPIFVQLGMKSEVSDGIIIKPSLLLTKPEKSKMRLDLNALATVQDRFTGGLSVRFGSTTYWQALLAYDVSKNIRIGYAYSSRRVEDFNAQTNNIAGVGKGIHEIVFTLQPNPQRD
jgi:type IX secretion system PorP/SprF family membrane protein